MFGGADFCLMPSRDEQPPQHSAVDCTIPVELNAVLRVLSSLVRLAWTTFEMCLRCLRSTGTHAVHTNLDSSLSPQEVYFREVTFSNQVPVAVCA